MIINRIFALSVQILIFCIILLNPASANPPIVLEGSVWIDGSPAPAGTEIKAMYEGSVVGTTTVDNVGLYSDNRDNRLGIPDGYDIITLFVNNIQANVLDLSNVAPGEIITVDIQATSKASSSTATSSSGGGGGGGLVATPLETPAEEVVNDSVEKVMSSTEDVLENETPVSTDTKSQAQSADFPTLVGIGSMLVAAGVLMRRKSKY